MTVINLKYENFSIYALSLGIIGWEIVDVMGPKGIPFPGFLFMYTFFCVILSSLPLLMSFSVRRSDMICLSLIALLLTSMAISSATHDWPKSQRHIISDYMIVVNFAVIYIVVNRWKDGFALRSKFKFIASGLFIAALIAPAASYFKVLPDFAWNNRYDPPHYGLIALIVGYFLHGRKNLKTYLLLLSIVLVLALCSGNRSTFLGFLFIVSFYLAAFRLTKITLSGLFFITFVGIALSFFKPTLLSETRLFDTSISKIDTSFQNRLLEVKDVNYTVTNRSSFLQMVLGHGAGAKWEVNYTPALGRDELNGWIHYIHITPVSVYFRYGLIGVVFLVWIYRIIISDAVRIFRNKDRFISEPLFMSFYYGAISFVVYSFFRFPLYDPPSVFFLCTYFCIRTSWMDLDQSAHHTETVCTNRLITRPRKVS